MGCEWHLVWSHPLGLLCPALAMLGACQVAADVTYLIDLHMCRSAMQATHDVDGVKMVREVAAQAPLLVLEFECLSSGLQNHALRFLSTT